MSMKGEAVECFFSVCFDRTQFLCHCSNGYKLVNEWTDNEITVNDNGLYNG